MRGFLSVILFAKSVIKHLQIDSKYISLQEKSVYGWFEKGNKEKAGPLF